MHRWTTLAARPRINWIVILVFVLLAALLGQLQPKLQERSDNADQRTWLPDGSESLRVLDRLEETIGGDDSSLAIVVFSKNDGSKLSDQELGEVERAVIAIEDHAESDEALAKVSDVMSPAAPQARQMGQVAEDGSVVTALVTIDGTAEPDLEPAVDAMRDLLDEELPRGIRADVTGPAGLVVDSVKVFGSIDGTLLAGTVTLVLVLLLLIYRSPLIAFVPLVTVAMSYTVAAGIVYLLDLPVNAQSTSILIVLMFGAGTDYCLLIVARYRDELRTHESTREAMRETLTHTSPAIAASGGTVVAAMLVLLLADADPTREMGPVLAIGIATTVLAGLLLLPSLLLVLGRRAFWPMIPRVGSHPDERLAFWRRIGAVVERRTTLTLVLPAVFLVVLACGSLVSEAPFLGFGSTDSLLETTDSTEGFDRLREAFPPGELAPNTVFVEGEDRAAVAQAVGVIYSKVADDPAVGRITPDETSPDGLVQTLALTTTDDPFGEAAADDVSRIRRELRDAAGEDVTVLLGGPTAQAADSNAAAVHDDHLLIPLILAVIFVILVVLLRALVAPLHLVASVVLSYLATIGLASFLYDHVFDHAGTTAGFATFVFLFVVALGVDYNIFLITRIREESAKYGTRRGTLEGLATTGGIITSAGLILAGTFAVLASLPVLFLLQLGMAVALGVLIDTFIVRGFIVPSTMLLLGERNWWPRHPAGDA